MINEASYAFMDKGPVDINDTLPCKAQSGEPEIEGYDEGPEGHQ